MTMSREAKVMTAMTLARVCALLITLITTAVGLLRSRQNATVSPSSQ